MIIKQINDFVDFKVGDMITVHYSVFKVGIGCRKKHRFTGIISNIDCNHMVCTIKNNERRYNFKFSTNTILSNKYWRFLKHDDETKLIFKLKYDI